MQQIYNSDKPIENKDQDRFNRYKFSSRIAETIIKRNGEEGLVIGLYGIWGEGKSSILNMIEQDLSENEEVLIIYFNPWKFKDEDALILNFFIKISSALDKELNSKIEKFGEFLGKYGSIASIFNIDLSEVGKSLSDANIEKLKGRVNGFLKESNKKVVVIIDDIDRLDKQELFAIFKLIKLIGDFKNTYYILAFDDEMVASSIGERYAEGNKSSGYNFLEKIIQVPLRIPQALSKDLLNYTFELINDTLEINEIDLGVEGSKVGIQISQNLLLKINTPRLAIRYANSLSFLIPLLKGEVNISDLILFEGVKIFYPQYYDFIKQSPEYFIEPYKNSYLHNSDKDKIEEFKQKIDSLNQKLSKKEQKASLNLIKHLFPLIKGALDNYNFAHNNWAKEKRIASAKYFNRYFLYSVPNDDISDVYFAEYINQLENKKIAEIINETSSIFDNIDSTEFLNKIGFYQDDLSWSQRKTIIKVICHYQEKFEGIKGGTLMSGFYNPKSQAAIKIIDLLSNSGEYKERFGFAQYLIKNIDCNFSFELIGWLHIEKGDEELIFKAKDIQNLKEILLKRVIDDCKKTNSNIFEKYSDHIFRLLDFWFMKSPQQLKKYIDKCLKENKDFQEVIIYELTTMIYSSSYPDPFKTDFKKESYEVLKKYYNVDKLFKLFSKKKYSKIRNTDVKFYEPQKGQTKANAIRQFLHWYGLDKRIQNEQIIEDAEIIE